MPNNCPNCGASINPGSTYCVQCGTKLPIQAAQPTYTPASQSVQQMNDLYKTKVPSSPKSNGDRIFPILTILLSILVVALAVFGFNQFHRIHEMQQMLETTGINTENIENALVELQEDNRDIKEINTTLERDLQQAASTIAQQEELISQKDNSIAELNSQIDLLTDDLELYQTLLDFLQSSDAGYASNYFHSVRPVYVMHSYDSPATFTLTADFSSSVTISLSTSGYAADVGFVESTYYDTTPVEINPIQKGVTYITFTNSVNNLSFRVMVLVVD